jgi:transposase
MTIHVGVDLHQRFCYVTAMKASGELLAQASLVNEAGVLQGWVRSLPEPAQVVVEACGFWPAFARAVGPVAERLVMVHPQRVKAIASARLKNDRVDSETLAHLSRCDLLPQAWMADEATQQLRLQVRLRVTLGRQRARVKNLAQAVLHQEGWRKPVSDLFGKRGRRWLAELELSPAGRRVVDTYLGLLDQLQAAIAEQDEQLTRLAATDARARWLQTIPGIGPYSAMVILAEVGEIGRFADKKALASYAGLVPRVRESAGKRSFGGISRQGSATLRWIMLQVGQVAARSSPAVRDYQQHLRRKKRAQVAKVAIARKLLCCVWALLHHGVCYDDQVFAAR